MPKYEEIPSMYNKGFATRNFHVWIRAKSGYYCRVAIEDRAHYFFSLAVAFGIAMDSRNPVCSYFSFVGFAFVYFYAWFFTSNCKIIIRRTFCSYFSFVGVAFVYLALCLTFHIKL